MSSTDIAIITGYTGEVG